MAEIVSSANLDGDNTDSMSSIPKAACIAPPKNPWRIINSSYDIPFPAGKAGLHFIKQTTEALDVKERKEIKTN